MKPRGAVLGKHQMLNKAPVQLFFVCKNQSYYHTMTKKMATVVQEILNILLNTLSQGRLGGKLSC